MTAQSHVRVEIDVTAREYDGVDNNLLCMAVQVAAAIAREQQDPARIGDAPIVVGVRVTSTEEVHHLNQQFRGVDKPTDVLSFSYVEETGHPTLAVPEWDEETFLGEIVLAYPIVVMQAHDLEHSVLKELAWLTIHGTLQLFGYTHDTDPDAEHMEALEQEALARLGLRDD